MKRKSFDLFVVHNLHFFCFSYLWSRLWKWRSMCWPQPVCMPLWFSRPTVSRRHWWMFHGAQCAQMFLRFHMCQQAWMVSSIQSTAIGPLILRFRYCGETAKLEKKNLPLFLKFLLPSQNIWNIWFENRLFSIGIISVQNRLMRGTSINKSQHKNPTSLAKANNNYFLCRLFPL